jgi:hypothetical protein
VKDAEMYYDYLELLQYFHKDLHNAKYVCPANLKEAHDLYMKRKRRQEREEEERTKRKRLIEDEAAYLQAKGKLLWIRFDTQDGIEIKTLDSVEEVMKEGDVLHHCVYTNEYYKKKDSLLLSARVKGKPVETVEVSLSQKKVMQSRGLCNKNSPYHDRIIEQVNRHIGELFVHRGDSLNQ